jgi:hypothetical protein
MFCHCDDLNPAGTVARPAFSDIPMFSLTPDQPVTEHLEHLKAFE